MPEIVLNCICEGACWIDDPSACGDTEHCCPIIPCYDCNPGGDFECANIHKER